MCVFFQNKEAISDTIFILILDLPSFIKMQFGFTLRAQLTWRQRNNIRERARNPRVLAHVNAIISEFGERTSMVDRASVDLLIA